MASSQTESPAAQTTTTPPPSDPIPAPNTRDQLAAFTVIAADGSSRPFASLYDDGIGTLIVFVRHAYCTVCHAYISALASDLPNPLPLNKRLIVIGQCSPELIPQYLQISNATNLFEMYSDPTAAIYKLLNFAVNQDRPAEPPEYVKRTGKGFFQFAVEGIALPFRWVGVGAIGDFIRGKGKGWGGSPARNGGEMWFESGELRWWRRMRGSQDHVAVSDIKAIMGL